MASDTTTAGALTTEQVQAILVQPLEQSSVFLASGPRIFDTNGSPVRVPKLTAGFDPDWKGENEQIDDDDPDYGEVTLLPQTMKSLKLITRLSNELIRQSVVALEPALRTRLVVDVSTKLDHALFNGDGGTPPGTEPLGILNWDDVQEIPSVGSVTLDDLHDARGMLLDLTGEDARLRWLMTGRDFVKINKLKDLQERYLVQPDPTQAGAFTLLGFPVRITNRIPKTGGGGTESAIVLADFSQIAVARDLAPQVTILNERYADFDQIGIRIVTRYDAAPLNPEAIVILRGVTP